MTCFETSGGWVASLMSERIVTTGMRSRRFMIGSSSRISEWPIWSSGIGRPSRLISEKSASRAGSRRLSPALRATTGTLRIFSRTCVTGMPVSKNCSCWAASAVRKADQIQPILIGDEAKHGRAIAPVAVRLPDVRDAPHDLEGFLGDLVQFRRIGPDDAKLDRERRVRAEHQLRDAHIGFRREPFRYRVPQTMLQGLASLGIGCQHHDLGEGRIGQLRRHGEEKSRSALSDIARDDLCIRLVLEPVFELLDRGSRRLDAGAFRQADLDQHFGTVGGREELLLHRAHANDGEREGDADDRACQELVAHGETDQPRRRR